MQEDEALFEKTDEDLVIVATTWVSLTQAISHNITLLNEKQLEVESGNLKLRDEIISLLE